MTTRRIRDKEKTVEAILSAARRLFSERGLHGASLRDIEQASGVSKGLILHHFGSKEALYAAVQERLNQEYVALQASRRPEGRETDLHGLIAQTVRSAFQYIHEQRDYRRIALWSYLEDQERAPELEQRFTLALVETMRRGQQDGLVRTDIDPLLMPFIIRGAIEYWIRKEQLIQRLATSDESNLEDLNERFVEALARLFLK